METAATSRTPAGLPTEELLQRKNGWQILCDRRSLRDQRLMVEAIAHGGDIELRNAVAALSQSCAVDVSLFPVLIEVIRNGPSRSRGRAHRVMRNSANDRVLPLARRWAIDDNKDVSRIGKRLVFDHGDASDLPWMRLQAQRVPDAENIYELKSAVKAFARLRDTASIERTEAIFEEAPCDWLRRRAAESLNKIDPIRFAQTYAAECLWDCDDCTRLLGCTTAPMSPRAHTRLVQLAKDALEEKDVREAAASRLGASL